MSFFDDTKKVGLALWIAGILMIVAALFQIVNGFVNDDEADNKIGWIIVGIGSLIAAFIFFGYGKSVHSGEVTDKFTIATKFVSVIGLMIIVTGIFTAIACVGFDDKTTYICGGIFSIVLGLIILWIYKCITNESVGTFDRLMWIVLVIIFAVSLIFSFYSFLDLGSGLTLIVNVVVAICNVIIYLFMLVYMFDKDVKAKFGM